MRWRDLFADLESEAESWERAELEAEVADRSRAEQALVPLADRLAASVGCTLAVRTTGAGELSGSLQALGADWMLMTEGNVESLVSIDAVLAVRDLGRRAVSEDGRSVVLARLRLSTPLRAIVRDRSEVRLVLRDGSPVVGTPERVGEDYLELLLHDPGAAARPSQAQGRLVVPFSAITVLRRAASGWG